MAMNGNVLGTAIANAIMHTDATPEARSAVIDIWRTIATEIVSHIQANALVQPGIAVGNAVPAAPGPVATAEPGRIE